MVFSTHLIESSIIPLKIIFEHRMYLPSIGLSLGTIIILSHFFSINVIKSPRFFIICILLLQLGKVNEGKILLDRLDSYDKQREIQYGYENLIRMINMEIERNKCKF